MHYEELGMRLDVQEHLEIVKLDRDRQEAVLLPLNWRNEGPSRPMPMLEVDKPCRRWTQVCC